MRKFMIGVSLVAVLQAACVSHKSAESTTTIKPYPLYQVRPLTSLTGRPNPRTSSASAPRQPRYTQTWFPRGKRVSSRWTHIVLHHSATDRGGAKEFDKYHRQKNGWDELGYHFVIGNGTSTPDGCVEVGSRWHKQKHGAHCKTPDNYYNDHGIGICLVGDFTKTRPTAKQAASLKRLVQFLTAQCHIRPDRVLTHKNVTPKTQCPGRFLQVSTVRRSLTGSRTASLLP